MKRLIIALLLSVPFCGVPRGEAGQAWQCDMCNKMFTQSVNNYLTQPWAEVDGYIYCFKVADTTKNLKMPKKGFFWYGNDCPYDPYDIDLCRRCVKKIIRKWLEQEDKKEADK
jgi:hypothetical protein